MVERREKGKGGYGGWVVRGGNKRVEDLLVVGDRVVWYRGRDMGGMYLGKGGGEGKGYRVDEVL